jgi:hypothetical protein
MAVGAYAAYNLALRLPELNIILVFLLAGVMAMLVGLLFGLPSLRIKGFYLAVATLAAQFFLEWAFARVKWFTNYAPSGSVAVGRIELFGYPIDTPGRIYIFVLALVVVLGMTVVSAAARGDGEGPVGAGGIVTPGEQGGPVVTSPSPSPSPPGPNRERIVIHGAGDISLDPGYITTYASQGYGYAWSGLNGLFRRDDLTVVNVECPVTDAGAQLVKEFSFHGTPDALPAMRDAGVEVGSLANNTRTIADREGWSTAGRTSRPPGS